MMLINSKKLRFAQLLDTREEANTDRKNILRVFERRIVKGIHRVKRRMDIREFGMAWKLTESRNIKIFHGSSQPKISISLVKSKEWTITKCRRSY